MMSIGDDFTNVIIGTDRRDVHCSDKFGEWSGDETIPADHHTTTRSHPTQSHLKSRTDISVNGRAQLLAQHIMPRHMSNCLPPAKKGNTS
jgi:hypothetical protein